MQRCSLVFKNSKVKRTKLSRKTVGNMRISTLYIKYLLKFRTSYMTSQIRVGIREDMHIARFEFHSIQTNRLAKLSCIEYDEFFLMSIKWFLVKRKIENLQKQKQHAKCP